MERISRYLASRKVRTTDREFGNNPKSTIPMTKLPNRQWTRTRTSKRPFHKWPKSKSKNTKTKPYTPSPPREWTTRTIWCTLKNYWTIETSNKVLTSAWWTWTNSKNKFTKSTENNHSDLINSSSRKEWVMTWSLIKIYRKACSSANILVMLSLTDKSSVRIILNSITIACSSSVWDQTLTKHYTLGPRIIRTWVDSSMEWITKPEHTRSTLLQ